MSPIPGSSRLMVAVARQSQVVMPHVQQGKLCHLYNVTFWLLPFDLGLEFWSRFLHLSHLSGDLKRLMELQDKQSETSEGTGHKGKRRKVE